MNYYEVLGLQHTASAEEIRKAYKQLARQYHPDHNRSPDAAKKFVQISEAYGVLSDPEERANYDRKQQFDINSIFTDLNDRLEAGKQTATQVHHLFQQGQETLRSLRDVFGRKK